MTPVTRFVVFARILFVSAACLVGSAHAQVQPIDAQFEVNTFTTAGQRNAEVAVGPGGGFVIVWDSDDSTGDPGSTSVAARLYDADGAPQGAQFQANTYTTSFQGAPQVAFAPNGDFVVAWSSLGSSDTDTAGASVQAQRYDATGAPIGTEFQVNTYTTGDQTIGDVAFAPDGTSIIAFTSDGSTGTDTSINSVQARRYAAAGTPIGAEFQLNGFTTNFQSFPRLAVDTDGSFVAAWSSSNFDNNSSAAVARRFDASGSPIGAEFQVNTYTTSYQDAWSVAKLAGGSFVVTWVSNGSAGTDTSQSSIQARVFDATGTALTSEFQVNTFTAGMQYKPHAAAGAGGGFVIQWTGEDSPSDADGWGVSTRCYDSAGGVACDEQTVNTYTTSNSLETHVAPLPTGGFVATWMNFGSSGADSSSSSIQSRFLGTCPRSPEPNCKTAASAQFQITDDPANLKDQLKWKWGKGADLAQAEVGQPDQTTAYWLCVYDSTAGTHELAASFTLAPSTLWRDKAPKGAQYKDNAGTQAGVTKAQLKTGVAGKSKAQLQAKGNVALPVPLSGSEFFDIDTAVTVQMHNSVATCLTSTFTTADVKKNSGTKFSAKAP
jgi:hypothetical protein